MIPSTSVLQAKMLIAIACGLWLPGIPLILLLGASLIYLSPIISASLMLSTSISDLNVSTFLVRQLRHDFGTFHTHFSALHDPTRAV